MKIDLFTHDPVLETLMIEEYPGNPESTEKLLPEQYQIDKTDKPHMYCFYDLDLETFKRFVHSRNLEYEIRDSKTEAIVQFQKVHPSRELN